MDNVIYANGFRMAVNASEVQLLLREETPIIDEEKNEITGVEKTNVADIRISPILAKNLCNKLQAQIDEYEKNYGTIVSLEN